MKTAIKKILPKNTFNWLRSLYLGIHQKLSLPRGSVLKKLFYKYYSTSVFTKRAISRQKAKKIVYLIPATTITGGIAVVCQHVNRLVKLGFEVSIVSKDNKQQIDWFPDFGGKIFPYSDNVWRSNIDILIATSWDTAFDLMRIKSKRKIYFVQSDESRFYPNGSFERLEAWLTYKLNYEFMVEAKWIKDWLKNNFNKDSHYVPMGLDKNIFFKTEPLTPKPKDKLRILLEGAINLPYKGMEDAFAVVQNLESEVWCVSNAGRPRKEWHCDRFFEKVPMEKMREIYSSCDVLLKMSKVEGLFCPPLEMMACGGANVVSKVTGYDEYIIDGQNAIVVEPGDIVSARNAINSLMLDKVKLTKLIENGTKTAKDWSWENTVEELKFFYNL